MTDDTILHCYCCGSAYKRSEKWRCCAPPNGMTFQRWSDQWHQDCETVGKRRCPKHCPHVQVPEPVDGWTSMPQLAATVFDAKMASTGERD